MLRLDRQLTDLSLFCGLRGALELKRPAGGVDVDMDRVSVGIVSTQYFCRDGVFDPLLNYPFEGAGAVGGVVAFLG